MIKSIIILLLLLSNCTLAKAQDTAAAFGSSTLFIYNQEKGLPQNTIRKMCFDKWGFLWMATFDGIARFDGRKVKSYPLSTDKAAIHGFVTINEDTIFAVTFDNEVLVITGGNIAGKLPSFSYQTYGIPLYNSITAISPQLVNVGSKNNKDSVLELLKRNSDVAYYYAKDSFLIFTNGVIGLYTKIGFTAAPIPNAASWLATPILLNKKIVTTDNSTNQLIFSTIKGAQTKMPLPFTAATPWSFYPGSTTTHFFIENNNKLYRVYEDSVTGRVRYQLLLNNFVHKTAVNSIMYKDDETLLVGTSTDGLYVYKKNRIVTFTQPPGANKYFNSSFTSQVLMPDNKTVLTGINLLFNKTGFIKSIPEFDVGPRAIYRDPENNYWAVGNNGHVFTSTNFEKEVKVFSPNLTNATGEPLQLMEDHAGNLWTLTEGTLGYFKAGTNTYSELVYVSSNNTWQPRFHCIEETKDNKILVGAVDGLYIVDPAKPQDGIMPYALKDIEIRYINVDKANGRTWICTKGKGMCSLKDNGKTVTFFPQDKYGDMRTVHHYVTDSSGRCWISTNNGLFVTSLQSLLDFDNTGKGNLFYYKISTADGLSSNEFNGGCQNPMLLLPDHSLTVSSITGLAWTNTDNFNNLFSKGKIFLEKTDSARQVIYADGSSLTLDHSQNQNITLTLSYVDWNQSFNIETAYLFSKNNESDTANWHEISSDDKITFSSLPTGDYSLILRKRSGFGFNDYVYTAITITVKPQWFETRWFYFLLGLLALVLIQVVIVTRKKRLQKANLVLQQKIQKASDELQEKNRELEKFNDTKDKLITLFNHDISVPVFYVNQILFQMASDKKLQELPGPTGENLLLMSNTVSDLNVLMGDLLYWVRLQQYNVKLQLENVPVDAAELISKTLHLFQFRIKSNDIELTKQMEEDIIIVTDERLFNSILYNVISNAIKFTQTGFLNIRLSRDTDDSNRFTLIFENSVAAPSTLPEEENKMNSSTDNDGSKKMQSRGIGLLLVEDFAQILGFVVTYKFGENGIFSLSIKGKIDPES